MIPKSKTYSASDQYDNTEDDARMTWEEYYEKEPLKEVIRRLIASTSTKTP